MMSRSTLIACAVMSLVACGGAQEKSPAAAKDEPHFVVMKDGKPAWPPTGPGCEALVACCKDASPGRPDVDLACQLSAVQPAREKGRRAVVEVLDGNSAPVPASCR